MKFSVAFVIVALASIVYAQESYPTKYDNIDIDGIIANDRLLNSYMECLQGKGKCTAEGAELKKYFEDAIETCCSKCSKKQKSGFSKVFRHLESNKVDLLNELRQKFDSTGAKEKDCRAKFSL